MKLTKEHRQALLAAWDMAQEEADDYKRCIDKYGKAFEAYHFLVIKRIELIKQSLIDDEIDY